MLLLVTLQAALAAPVPDLPTKDQWIGQRAPLVFDGGANDGMVVGLARRLKPPYTALPVHLVALDTDLAERWRIEDLGDDKADYAQMNIRLARAGGLVVLVDAKRRVRGIDAGSGVEKWRTEITDYADDVCIVDANHAWVGVVDTHNVLVDLRDGRVSPSDRPDVCRGLTVDHGVAGPVAASGASAAVMGPREPSLDVPAGLRAQGQMPWSKHAVVLANKAPGTPVRHVLGVSDKVVWQRTLDATDPFRVKGGLLVAGLRGDRVYIEAERSDDSRVLLCISAQTGKTIWQTDMPNGDHDVDVMIVGKRRIWVGRWTWLDVFDASDGAHIKTIGEW